VQYGKGSTPAPRVRVPAREHTPCRDREPRKRGPPVTFVETYLPVARRNFYVTNNVVELKPWHRPRIVTVETTGPLRCCKIFRLFDGRVIVVPGTAPEVTIEFDAAPLLRAIADVVIDLEDDNFTTRELCDHAKAAGGPLLAVIGNRSEKQLGKLFRKIMGKQDGGLSIVCNGKQDNAALWQIVEKVEC